MIHEVVQLHFLLEVSELISYLTSCQMFQMSTSEQDAKHSLGSNEIGGLGLCVSLGALMDLGRNHSEHLPEQASLFI